MYLQEVLRDGGRTTTIIDPDLLCVGSFVHIGQVQGFRSLTLAKASPVPADGEKVVLHDKGRFNDPGKIVYCVNWILNEWERNNPVFVSCNFGMNRSPLIAAAALTVSKRFSDFDSSLDYLKIKRSEVRPNPKAQWQVKTVALTMLVMEEERKPWKFR
jgi:hypothetical protein